MSDIGDRSICLLLVYLVVSVEVAQPLLVSRVFAQQENFDEFLSKLENYLKGAIPPESEPIKECEYIVPGGLGASDAEFLWRDLAPFVSLGCYEDEIREHINGTRQFEIDGGVVTLNFTSLSIERRNDGSVRVKIPATSDSPLNFSYYNSTNVKVLYEVWNETLVRYYEVEKFSGVYSYGLKDLRTGREYTVDSRLALSAFSAPIYGATTTNMMEVRDWGLAIAGVSKFMVDAPLSRGTIWFGTPVVAVPGHYEEVEVLVPEQRKNLKVLFPAYDPAIYEGWLVDVSAPSSVLLGESFEISFSASPVFIDPDVEPLDADVSALLPDAFEAVGGPYVHLSNSAREGNLTLRSLRSGTYEITLKLDGNANFNTWPPGVELNLAVQVVGPSSPSLNIVVSGLDTSMLKRSKLTVEFRNEGGSKAKDVFVEVTGEKVEDVSRSLGDIEAGDAKREEFTLRMLAPESSVRIKVTYHDEEGNPYLATAQTAAWTRSFVVPEHFEEYTVVVPEHEETRRVFVPGYEGYTHVRFYALHWNWGTIVPGWMVAPKFRPEGGYGGSELLTALIPCPSLGFELDVSKEPDSQALSEDKVNIMVTKLEPRYDRLGTFDEENATELLGVGVEELRAGEAPQGYRVNLVSKMWESSDKLTLNSTEFELYRARMERYLAEGGEGLRSEFRWNFARGTNASRTSKPADEEGFLTLIYRPLSVKGGGALRSIQVKNYANYNLNYTLRIFEYDLGGMAQRGQPLWEHFTKSFQVRSRNDSVLLAGELGLGGHEYRVQLLFHSKVVVETVFNLYPEPSPFWTGFWDAIVREKLFGILLSTTFMVVISVTTGCVGGALAVNTIATASSFFLHYVLGSKSNVEQIVDAMSMSSFLDGLIAELEDCQNEFERNSWSELASLAKLSVKDLRDKKALLWADLGLDLTLGFAATDIMKAAGLVNATEYERGYSFGRIVGSILGLATYAYVLTQMPRLQGALSQGDIFPKVKQAFYNWITPAILDAGALLVKAGAKVGKDVERVFSRIGIWKRVSADYDDHINRMTLPDGGSPEGSEKILRQLETHPDIFDKTVEIARGRDEGFAKALLDTTAKCLKQVGEAETNGLVDSLSAMVKKSKLAGGSVVEWLRLTAESGGLREVLDSDIVGKISELEEDELEDIGKAWELNRDVADFNELLKGLSFTLDYPVQGKSFYDLLHECVESRDVDKVRFLERGYGWIAEVRTMPLEPDQRPAKIVEKAFPFIRDALHTLGGDRLEKVSNILDNLLESRGKKGAYDEMLRLKRHLFVDIGLGGEEPKAWLVDECLKKWGEASRLSDAIVSHQILDKNGHYTTRSPVEVNYLDAGDGNVIPVIAAKDIEGGFGIAIPRDAAEYLKLREEGFVMLREHRNALNIIIPVEVEADGRVALTEWLSRVLRAVCSEEEALRKYLSDGEVDWGRVESDRLFFDFSYEKGGEHVEKSLLLRNPEGKSIRVRLGEEMGNRMVVLTGIEVSSWEKTVSQAEAVFRDVGYDEEKARMLAKKYYEIAVLKDAEAELLDGRLKGLYGEAKTVKEVGKVDPDMLEAVRDRYDVEGSYPELGLIGGESHVEIDITLKRMLVSVKYWSEETFRENLGTPSGLEKNVEGLRKYRVAMVEKGKERVVLVFARDLSMDEDEFNMYVNGLYEALGEGSRSWLDVMMIKDLSAYLEGWR